MAIVFRSSSSLTNSSRTSTVITMPAGVQSGDEVRIVVNVGGPGAARAITPPGAVTLVASVTWGDGSWTVRHSVYRYRVVGAPPTSFTFTHTSSASDGGAFAYAGVDATSPDDATAVTTSIANTGPFAGQAILNGLTTVTADTMLVIARGSWDGNAITPPAGWTERLDQPITWVGDSPNAATGATGTISIPSGNGPGVTPAGGIVMALRPASGGSSFAASGTVTAASDASGAVTAKRPASGTVGSASSTTGAITARLSAQGAAESSSTVAGEVAASLPTSGTAESSSTVTGQVTSRLPSSGTVEGVSSAAGDLTAHGGMAGAVTAESSATGSVTSRLPAGGSVEASSAVTGAVTLRLPTTGTVTAASSVTGAMEPQGGLSGTILTVSAVTGRVTARLPFAGAIHAATTVTGRVTSRMNIAGAAASTSSAVGNLSPSGGYLPFPDVRTLAGAWRTTLTPVTVSHTLTPTPVHHTLEDA